MATPQRLLSPGGTNQGDLACAAGAAAGTSTSNPRSRSPGFNWFGTQWVRLFISRVVNIGSTEEVSIAALAQLVKQRTGSKSPIVSVPYDQAYEPGFEDMPRRVPALEKLEELTGFRPGIPLNDIVDGVVTYFQDKANAAVGTVAGSGESYPMAAKASAD